MNFWYILVFSLNEKKVKKLKQQLLRLLFTIISGDSMNSVQFLRFRFIRSSLYWSTTGVPSILLRSFFTLMPANRPKKGPEICWSLFFDITLHILFWIVVKMKKKLLRRNLVKFLIINQVLQFFYDFWKTKLTVVTGV